MLNGDVPPRFRGVLQSSHITSSVRLCDVQGDDLLPGHVFSIPLFSLEDGSWVNVNKAKCRGQDGSGVTGRQCPMRQSGA